METINVQFNEKFEQILKEEAEGFSIDWSLVDIKYTAYEALLITSLPADFGKKMVSMLVLGFEGTIPDIDNWFRSHEFTYAIFYKESDTEFNKSSMLSLGNKGTPKDIATKLRDIFRDFEGES